MDAVFTGECRRGAFWTADDIHVWAVREGGGIDILHRIGDDDLPKVFAAGEGMRANRARALRDFHGHEAAVVREAFAFDGDEAVRQAKRRIVQLNAGRHLPVLTGIADAQPHRSVIHGPIPLAQRVGGQTVDDGLLVVTVAAIPLRVIFRNGHLVAQLIGG